MTQDELVRVKSLVSRAAVYIPSDDEPIRVNAYDDDTFFGYGEDSDIEYVIRYDEVDLSTAMFYKLVLIDNNE